MSQPSKSIFSHLENDWPAGLVVFLVALPLCLGIALASGAPLFSGIIAGVVGGLVAGSLSGSHTSVSGPAAGLTVIASTAITEMGSFELFLSAVFLAGVFQVILGVVKAGVIGYYFPTAVIKGLLAGIGILLILKQLPYALGFDSGEDLAHFIPVLNGMSPYRDLQPMSPSAGWGAMVITAASMMIFWFWNTPVIKTTRFIRMIPGPLVVVLSGIALNQVFQLFIPNLYLAESRRVILPVVESWNEARGLLVFPDFSRILHKDLWMVAVTIGVIASLETLLSLEAADKVDPFKRISPPNRELFAQGVSNMINGLIGGLPVTAVIVRSSANITSGARTKMSAIFHGILLLGSVFLIPRMLNLIPLASLAAILLQVGYKLTRVSLFKKQIRLGRA
ncbi:MAG: SulP family inorganic anion transporter, partial [Kiritimatiellia bacterium]|nr:SulP family inorganic anion transporter [Kiritimatiellia bacterium]